jgi:predicted regulator of Ras-like GTPase activity (Roadblock/LC7/MglB family)
MTENNAELDTDETLQEKLQELKNQDGIIGYILRCSNSAAIDLKDPTKIIDYAVLSSAVLDIGCKMTENFQVGPVERVVVESEETTMLSMNTGNKLLTVFMEKAVDPYKVYSQLK